MITVLAKKKLVTFNLLKNWLSFTATDLLSLSVDSNCTFLLEINTPSDLDYL